MRCGDAGGKRKSKWILASASPRRREILSALGLRFCVDPSGLREPQREPGESPSKYVLRIARLKAEKTAKRHPSGLILGVDTLVVIRNRILGKPQTRAEARAMLNRLSGRWHEVLSGIFLMNCKPGRYYSAVSRSRVHFRQLQPGEIDWYLKTGEYKDKAGAYGIQGRASLFIDCIEGCYFNIVGFPVALFEKLCGKAGINLY